MKEWTAAAVKGNIPVLTEDVDRELEALGCSPKARRQIDVALDELLTNIANYAYAPGTGDMTVQMRYHEAEETVSLTFVDRGVPYNPLEHEDPDVTLAAADRPIGGLGILMVKKMATSIAYARINNRNRLTIYKQA